MKERKLNNLSIFLLSFALFIGFLRGILIMNSLKEHLIPILFFTIIFTLFTIFIIYQIYKNQKWAKIFFVCYFVLGLILNFGNIFVWYQSSTIVFYLYSIESFINLLAIILIFRK